MVDAWLLSVQPYVDRVGSLRGRGTPSGAWHAFGDRRGVLTAWRLTEIDRRRDDRGDTLCALVQVATWQIALVILNWSNHVGGRW